MWKVFRIIQSNINSLEIFWQVWLKFSFWMGLFYLLNSSSKFTWLRFLELSKSTNRVILPFYNPDFVCFWLFRRNIMLLVNKIAYRTFERNLSLKTNLVLKNTYSANLVTCHKKYIFYEKYDARPALPLPSEWANAMFRAFKWSIVCCSDMSICQHSIGSLIFSKVKRGRKLAIVIIKR